LLLGRDGLIRVNDPRNSRLSFMHPDTGYTGSVPLEVLLFGYLWRAVMDTADHLWEYGMVIQSDRRTYVLKGYDPQGRWTDTVPQLEPEDSGSPRGVYSYRTARGGGMMQVPFWPMPTSTMDAGRAIWSKPSNQNDYRIARVTFTGDTTLTFESRRPAVPVTAHQRDSTIAAIRERVGADFDWSQIPADKPIVTQLFPAENGDVWVRVTTADDSLTTFDVYGGDGRYKGTAVTSLRVAPYLQPVVRGDQFWAVVRDELDVAYIARGRLVPRTR
jgi:hypothetical protein